MEKRETGYHVTTTKLSFDSLLRACFQKKYNILFESLVNSQCFALCQTAEVLNHTTVF